MYVHMYVYIKTFKIALWREFKPTIPVLKSDAMTIVLQRQDFSEIFLSKIFFHLTTKSFVETLKRVNEKNQRLTF
jgi:hypothetical protein